MLAETSSGRLLWPDLSIWTVLRVGTDKDSSDSPSMMENLQKKGVPWLIYIQTYYLHFNFVDIIKDK